MKISFKIIITFLLFTLMGCETPQTNPSQYPLTLSTNVDGVNFSSDLISNYEEGFVLELESIEINGYEFVHWIDLSDERVLSENHQISIVMSRSQRIQAIYEKTAVNFQVNFLDNEGLLDTQFVSESAILESFPAARPKEGYRFTGWNYQNQAINEDIFIDAMYEKNQYTVSYYDNGRLLNEVSVEYNEEIPAFEVPTKEDYIFKGFEPNLPDRMPAENLVVDVSYDPVIKYYEVVFISEEVVVDQFLVTEGATAVPIDFEGNKEGYSFIQWQPSLKNITQHTTFTAVYVETIPETVLVSFVFDTNELVSRFAIGVGSDVTPPNSPTKEGYTFVGWDKPFTNITEATTFNALFDVNEYTIGFYLDGNLETSRTFTFDQTISNLPTPSKEGLEFIGWSPSLPDTMPSSNLTVSAIFEEIINYFDVTFIDQGTVVSSYSITEGATATPPTGFVGTKEGHTFNGWDKTFSNITENTVFNSVYIPSTYQAIFYVDAEVYLTESYQTGESIVVPEAPTKANHIFINWTPSLPSVMPSESISFSAVFESVTTEPSERLEIRFDTDEDHQHSLNDEWEMTCEAFDTETEEVLPCYAETPLDTKVLGVQVVTYYGFDSDGLRYEIEVPETVFIDETVLDIDYTGYYDGIEGLYGEVLLLKLREIIQNGFNPVTYGEARDVLEESDVRLDDDSQLLLIYDRKTTEAIWDRGSDWNREHVWSQSYLGASASNNRANIASDVHNLRAANPSTNSSRGNKYFDFTTTSSTYFPGEDRGDVARIYFYMIVMYPQLSLSDSPNSGTLTMGLLSSILAFHYDDPVDAFEINRNEILFGYQGNRNPFIDHPHLVDLIFFNSDDLPAS